MRTSSVLGVLILVAIIAVGAWYLYGDRDGGVPQTGTQAGKEAYSSNRYGITFQYPDTYLIEENDDEVGGVDHHSIMIVEDTKENRDVLDGKAPGREGPVAVTIDIYEKPDSTQTLEAWIRATSASNFQLSPDARLSTTTFQGRQAFTFRWSGLYEGDSIAFLNAGRAVVVSGTWLTRNDPIREVFSGVVESMKLNP